jgi:hypothetical protein
VLNNNLFVRLTNNVLQVYIARAEKQGDSSLIFTLQLHYNANALNEKQIMVLTNTGEAIVFDSYATASSSPYYRYVEYVRRVFEVMLDNSLISL